MKVSEDVEATKRRSADDGADVSSATKHRGPWSADVRHRRTWDRSSSPHGHDPNRLEGEESDEIQPFGYWLFERVDELSEQLLPWLDLVQDAGLAEPGNSSDGDGADEATRKTYLEYRDEKSSKFWEIELDGVSHTVRYGRIGSEGWTLTKEFDSTKEARESAEKLIESKVKKGYEEVDSRSDS